MFACECEMPKGNLLTQGLHCSVGEPTRAWRWVNVEEESKLGVTYPKPLNSLA